MKPYLLDEPPLQFADGRHIDIRAGLVKYGAFSRDAGVAPSPIGIGLIGTQSSVTAVAEWFESCQKGVASHEEKYKELRPGFPGMTPSVYGTRLRFADVTTRSVPRNDLLDALAGKEPVQRVVELFLQHARDLAMRPNVHVLVVAPPAEVFGLSDSPHRPPDGPIDDAQDEEGHRSRDNFHDCFKARALPINVPVQILRPDTYGGGTTRGREGKASLQDLATRAWNLHTTLYYKAGGVPWRLVNPSSGYDTCYVGASFFQTLDRQVMHTSIAQVFNDRGEGLIVQGGNARINDYDLTAHLRADDARALLSSGLATYRREHHHMPARVVVHKTSYFDDEELDGFRQAAKDERIETLDLVWVKRSDIRLFRAANLAVRRGTVLQLDDSRAIVYLKGTVPYFKIYPGPYVPRPLEFVREDGETPPLELAKELLELSKLNFNNTQFDSGDPITIRAARRVGDMLKHVPPGMRVENAFRFFT